MRIDVPNSGTLHAIERGFNYSEAFSRNIGWVSEFEQQTLRKKTVAIAGMGGVGGAHALTLARLGIGGFHIADFDRFDVVNLNRQAGAFISTINLEKAPVMAQMMRDINPELRLEAFSNGLDEHNLDAFLNGIDLFVDGLDFFAIDIRRKAFERCYELNIPAITAAPIGFGASYLIFMPGGMSFEEYFRLEGLSEEHQYVNFALGLTPKGFHRSYLVDPSRLDLAGKRGPSTAAAIQLCSGVVGAEAVKILAQRGKIYAAPAYHQFDAYRGRWHRGYLRHGNAGPLQSLKRHVGYRAFEKLSKAARPKEEAPSGSDIEQILDIARWAPSGDNSQPWNFKIINENQVRVLITPNEQDIYDYNDGQPTLLATGMLVETIRIAASRFGRACECTYKGLEGRTHTFLIDLHHQDGILEDSLLSYIAVRSVVRRRYQTRRLTVEQKNNLQLSLGEEFEIRWYESLSERWRAAKLNAKATSLRLRLRSAYEVHRRIIDWDHNFSRFGVPAKAVGLDFLTLRLMRFLLGDWKRTKFMSGLPGGTLIPKLELDILPGIGCAAHFSIFRRNSPEPGDEITSIVRAGQALQRFWLTATAMGLSMQPTIAPLIFGFYAGCSDAFTDVPKIKVDARSLSERLVAAENFDTKTSIFRGRLGWPLKSNVASRSIRKELVELNLSE